VAFIAAWLFGAPSAHGNDICRYSDLISRERGNLNTDVLRRKWGAITVDVARQNDRTREVYFRDRDGKIRGYAATTYSHAREKLPGPLELPQRLIEQGGSIGETFRNLGFEILKEEMTEEMKPVPEELREPLGAELALKRAYRFKVRTPKGQVLDYAWIEEWTPL
jgi:hypothetical protein